mmetsp:Transcript_21649/g.32791  ORF Transcript_21649/g.32791 Transcript_21649/m.32791 type:complete len:469 (-) Transcript_21649:978-2384(-)
MDREVNETKPPTDNVGVCLLAWKRRSGVSPYLSQNFWEQRWISITGTKLAYYKLGEEDGEIPRGIIDLIENKVSLQVISRTKDAPTPHLVEIQYWNETRRKENSNKTLSPKKEELQKSQWKFCFYSQEDQMHFLAKVNEIMEESGALQPKDRHRFEHNFQTADHIYRWEMIVCPPVIYPIQIHGIVLSAGRNCIVVADFGLTGYCKQKGKEFHHADDDKSNQRHFNMILARWRKLRPNQQDQRLNIVTMTDPIEIRKWSRAGYGDESMLASSKSLKKQNSILFGKQDPNELVLARANFLLEHMEALPPYHVFYSNSECIAVWCKVGRWATLQTAVWATCTSVGGAKSATAMTIGVAAAHGPLAPVVAAAGLAYATAPMMILKKSQEKWEQTTLTLTNLFWAWADPVCFVAAIEAWSGLFDDLTHDGLELDNRDHGDSKFKMLTGTSNDTDDVESKMLKNTSTSTGSIE